VVLPQVEAAFDLGNADAGVAITALRATYALVLSRSSHSMAAATPATLGGSTTVEGVRSRPAWSNSLSPGASVADVSFIDSANSPVRRLTTKAPVSRAFRAVSVLPSSAYERWPGANSTVGGSVVATLKKEYGARLSTPSVPVVDIQPMGRGTTRLVSVR